MEGEFPGDKGRNMAVKLGIMHSGKELESELLNINVTGLRIKPFMVAKEAQEFWEKLYLKGEKKKLALSKAKNLLLISGGNQLDSCHSSRPLLYGYLPNRLAAYIGEDTSSFQ